jgi:flavin reductase (DIM6/NTAB) family NADH-FMN oxidoreductase RutF
LETQYYTINFVGTTDFEKAHQTSAKYETHISEFDACGFTELYQPDFSAPFVAEAHVKVGLRLQQKLDIPINNTILIIGSIECIELEDEYISSDGFVSLDKSKTLACAGLDAYYETRLIERLSYATTDTWPQKLA